MAVLKGIRLIIIAAIAAVIAAAAAMMYLREVEQTYRLQNQPVQETMASVVVANQNLIRGQKLTLQTISSRDVPEKYLPANAVLAADYLTVVDRTLLAPVERGRPLTWEAVTDFAGDTFSDVIPIGRRAFTVRVSRIESFDGLLRPGDVVDIMGSFRPESLGLDVPLDAEIDGQLITPVVSQVRVLSASRQDFNGTRYELVNAPASADNFDMEFTSITLEVTEDQVLRLQMAQQTGSIFPVLKNPNDTTTPATRLVGPELLLTAEPEPTVDLVLDANGTPVGRVIGDTIVDATGQVIGRMVDGKAVALDGTEMGTVVRGVSEDDPVNRVAEVADVVRDADGKIIGKVVDGNIVDKAGNIIGKAVVAADGSVQAVDLQGNAMGVVETGVALDASGNEVDLSSSQVLGDNAAKVEVVRDASGKLIGRIVDGQVIDASGQVIGRVENGQLVDLAGNLIADGVQVSQELSVSVNAEETQIQQQQNPLGIPGGGNTRRRVTYDFIGNDADNGVIPLRKIQVEK
ncbi:Flp pilus assembly protein CpaB [Litorivicinus lipolyticus]|uniref:Flp pilus assembly protein CpaB n=1 Tax=Litorivicinus lipolyticus TaxID=418701 RepID=UPI003B58D6EF